MFCAVPEGTRDLFYRSHTTRITSWAKIRRPSDWRSRRTTRLLSVEFFQPPTKSRSLASLVMTIQMYLLTQR